MIELCSQFLSVRCIWLCVLIMSRMRFRVNPHSIDTWMSRNSLLETGVCETRTCAWNAYAYVKRIRDMIRTRSQMHRTDKNSQHSSIIWPFWLNGWVFVYELSGCGFESSFSHLRFRFYACVKQGVPWHSGNYRMWIHSETFTLHDNILLTLTSW